jgi:hypothetical protein
MSRAAHLYTIVFNVDINISVIVIADPRLWPDQDPICKTASRKSQSDPDPCVRPDHNNNLNRFGSGKDPDPDPDP